MYTLLIVDDEILELETLRDYVDWESMDIKVAGTAKNGRDALAKAQELKPDIIITDVKMPIMDGIEFSKRLREFNKTVKLVFLTGYDDFNYARTALQLQASDYILKPFSMDELTETVTKIKKELEADKLSYNSIKLYIENRFKYLLHLAVKEEIAEIAAQLKKAGNHDFAAAAYNIMVVYCSTVTVERWKDVIYSMDEHGQILIEDSHCTVLISSDAVKLHGNGIGQLAGLLQSRILEESSEYADIIYSDLDLQFEDLANTYKKLIDSEEVLFYREKNCLLNASLVQVHSPADVKLPSIESKITEAIFSYDKEKVKDVMDGYFDFIIKNKLPKSTVLESLFNILLYLWEDFFRHNQDIKPETLSKNELWNELMNCRNIYSAMELTTGQTDKISEYLISKQKDKNQYVVDKIMKFVEKNFHRPITINDVAADVYLSPNYVRNIFKEKTGETFLEYLTAYRMKKAAELLKDKSLKVHEVSNMVSYENVSYFCSVFAKSYGVSPNEYRNKY